MSTKYGTFCLITWKTGLVHLDEFKNLLKHDIDLNVILKCVFNYTANIGLIYYIMLLQLAYLLVFPI